MTEKESIFNAQIERILSLIPSGEDAQAYLRNLMESQTQSPTSEDTSLGPVSAFMLAPPSEPYASARIAVELLNNLKELAERRESFVDLGFIDWSLRPALPLRDGLLDTVINGEWQDLRQDVVRDLERSVCRLDIDFGSGYRQVGTGFVVAIKDDNLVIMTNAHVVKSSIPWQPGAAEFGWPEQEHVRFASDFARYSSFVSGKPLRIGSDL